MVHDRQESQRPCPGELALEVCATERSLASRRLLELEERPRFPNRDAEALPNVDLDGPKAEKPIETMAHDDLQQVPDPRLARADDAHGVDEARVERERIGVAGIVRRRIRNAHERFGSGGGHVGRHR